MRPTTKAGTLTKQRAFRWLSEDRASPQSQDRNDPGPPPWLLLPSQMLQLLPDSGCSQHPHLEGTGSRYQCGRSNPFASYPMSSSFPSHPAKRVSTLRGGFDIELFPRRPVISQPYGRALEPPGQQRPLQVIATAAAGHLPDSSGCLSRRQQPVALHHYPKERPLPCA